MKTDNHAKERNEVLFTLDEGLIRRYYKRKGAYVPQNERIFWNGIYRTILSIPEAPPRVRDAAMEGLRKMGVKVRR